MRCTDLQSDGVDIISGGGDVHHEGLGDDLGRSGHLADGPDPLTGHTEARPLLPDCQADPQTEPEGEEDCDEIFHVGVDDKPRVFVSSQSAVWSVRY